MKPDRTFSHRRDLLRAGAVSAVFARHVAATAALTAVSTGVCAQAPASTSTIAQGLEHPWSLAFLPDGVMLVTERPGRLRTIGPDGHLGAPIKGVPRVHARGQGGLLDVVPSPDFAKDRRLFLSFAQPAQGGARSAVARGTLSADGSTLSDVEVIFTQKPVVSGNNHFGSRLVFARDGSLYVTLGDRWSESDQAQDLASHIGKIVRIRPDGSVPPDNPFVDRKGALPEIHSYGHRNLQGAALHPQTGVLWTHEHGPQGGDEVNVQRAGANYGWPVITTGRQYVSGLKIGEGTRRADVEPPIYEWTPSIAPSGMTFLESDRYPDWRGNLFVGSLKFRLLVRLELDGTQVVREERMLDSLSERIRDVRQGPDGLLYLLTDSSDGKLLRIEPPA